MTAASNASAKLFPDFDADSNLIVWSQAVLKSAASSDWSCSVVLVVGFTRMRC